MIDEGRNAIAVNNLFAAVESKQICVWKIVVEIVGLIARKIGADVFYEPSPFANRARGVTTVGVDARLANDDRHRSNNTDRTIQIQELGSQNRTTDHEIHARGNFVILQFGNFVI